MIAPAVAVAGALVTMPGQLFTPGHVTTLVGEPLVWRNVDNTAHTVKALDGAFDSGRIEPGGEFSLTLDRPGSYAYRCALHRFMRGTIEVAALALDAPAAPVRPGAVVTLTGRAPAGTAEITLEREPGGPVATALPDAAGHFSFGVRADAPGRYRARAGALASGVASVAVAPEVRLAARRGRKGISIRVHVPAQPRATVVLERYVRERFAYVRLQKVRLDAQSRARLTLHTGARLRLRARLALPVGGFSRSAGTPVVVTRNGATRARDHH
jgi:hypothetical protein